MGRSVPVDATADTTLKTGASSQDIYHARPSVIQRHTAVINGSHDSVVGPPDQRQYLWRPVVDTSSKVPT